MILKYVLPLVAVAGAAFAVRTVVLGSQVPVVPRPVAEPPKPPFEAYISGSGIVEASSENVAISTPLPGLVMEVAVRPGARVAAGALLFRLDDRDLRAQLEIERAGLAAAQARRARLEALPRVEDLRNAQAGAVEAKAQLEDARRQLALVESVSDPRAMSKELLTKRRSEVETAEARLAAAQSQVDWHTSGAWKPDLAVASAECAQAEARVHAVETQIERLSVRAPIDASVLQVNLRAGEYAQIGALARPLIVLGAIDVLHVRVDIDENDAWRFRDGAPAHAFVRGNRALHTPLELVRIEPYVIPKRSLTGDSTERVDTRVLQALYRFDPKVLPTFVGQQVDVYIEAAGLEAALEASAQAGEAQRSPTR